MAGSAETRIEEGCARVALYGRIDHRSRPAFGHGIGQVLRHPQLRGIVVDLRRASALDSVTLGLILVLRDHARQQILPFEVLSSGGELDDTLRLAGLCEAKPAACLEACAA